MLDKQTTNASAAIEQAILEKTSCMPNLRQMPICPMPMPQQSNDRADRASACGSVDLEFDSESRQTDDLKIGIHSFPA